MAASALHTPARSALLREQPPLPVSPQEVYGVLNLPRGFRAEISYGRLRIGHADRRVDDVLVDLGERLAAELPGIRVELYAGWIVVSGLPEIRHNDVVCALIMQLFDFLRERRWVFYQTVGVSNPATREHVIPDLLVAPRGAPRCGSNTLDGHSVLLAVEVTSPSGATDDRTHKWVFYGRTRVPLYLLLDLERGEVVLHSDPFDGGYRDSVTVTWGKPLPLPEPFEITIDTGDLLL